MGMPSTHEGVLSPAVEHVAVQLAARRRVTVGGAEELILQGRGTGESDQGGGKGGSLDGRDSRFP
jgi:hypothetical protein